MTFEEKRAWMMAVTATVAYAIYATIILGRADHTPLTDVPYVATLLWTIGLAIVAQIVLSIVIAISSPRDADKKDERDRVINRFGEQGGQWFVIAGAVAALVLAMAHSDYFWIANVIYLAFVLSSILGSVVKVVTYRRGFRPW